MSSDTIYPRRLEDVVLLDGKDLDISDVAYALKKDCIKLFVGYVFALIFSVSFLSGMIVFSDITFSDALSTLKAVIVMIILFAIVIFSVCGMVAVWRVRCKKAFRGIRGTCDNLIKSYSKGGNYTVYHCTTELDEHGIAFVNGFKQRVDIGDPIVYIRVFNHDFIYADKRGKMK